MKAQARYTIPSMAVKEITEYLVEHGFNILESDIKSPSAGYIVRLYEGILSMFVEEKATEGLDESACIAVVYTRMKRYLERIGHGVLQLKDVTHPEAGRTVKILSSVVNFALFKESKRHVYAGIYRRREEIEAKIEAHNEEIQKKVQTLKKKREEKNAAQKKAKALLNEIAEKEAEIVNFHRTQQSVVSDIEEVKREYSAVTEKINAEKCYMVSTAQEIAKLQAKIVKNPKELRELLIKMKNDTKDEEEILKEYERRIARLHENISEMKTSIEDLKALVCTVSLAGEYKSKLTSLVYTAKRIASENSNMDAENRMRESKKALLDKKIAYIMEKINTLTQEDEARMADMKREFDKLREKHAHIAQERERVQGMIQANNEKIKELEKEVINIEAAHESMLLSVYNDLVYQNSHIAGYAEDIAKVFRGEYLI